MKRLLFIALCMYAAGAFAEIQVLPGSAPQTTLVGGVLPAPVQLRVVENGMPVAGAEVSFYTPFNAQFAGVRPTDQSICPSDGDLMPLLCIVVAGSDGIARFDSLTNRFAGTYHVEFYARSPDRTRDLGSVSLDFTFTPKAPPVRLTLLSGAEQYVVMGTNALLPLRFKVETPDGRPVVGTLVSYDRGSDGPDSLGFHYPSPQTRTDAAGVATSPTIHGGWAVGTFPLGARVFDPDAGQDVAITVGINIVNEQGIPDVDLTNMWWSGPSQNGWGMSIVKHRDQLFNVLFVYDPAGQPTWYVMPGGRWSNGLGGSFAGDLYSPIARPWFEYDANLLVPGAPIGRMFIDFKGPRHAGFGGYIAFDRSGGLAQGLDWREIEPQDFRGSTASPITGLADMWWGGPSQNGWGIAILEQYGNLFSVWFTYGADGKPTWFVMPGGTWTDLQSYSGAIYKTVGTDWVFGVYDASKLQASEVGRYTFRFLPDGRATFAYVLEGRTGTLPLERQPF